MIQQWHVLLETRPRVWFVSGRGGFVSLAEFQQQRGMGLWWPLPAQDLPNAVTIIRSGGLGDILLMRPAIRALRAARPDIHIRIITDWPMLANGDTNTDELAAHEDEVFLFLNEWVERAPWRYTMHRSDVFAWGMGVPGCSEYSFDNEVHIDCRRPLSEDYIVLQYGGSNVFRCPSVKWLNELAARLPLPTVAVTDAPVAAEVTYNMTPTDRDTLLALVAHARLVIAGDSGPFHLARAMGVPCIGLYGPIPADLRVRDAAPTCRVAVSRLPYERSCGPCQERGHCGKLAAAECLDAISIDEVVTIAEELLGG